MSNGDPFDSDKPRGKSNAKRMGRYDGSYTPTEQRLRDSLMKQFCRDEGPPPSSAYLNAPCWCECGRLKAEGKEQCARCLGMDAKSPKVVEAPPYNCHPDNECWPDCSAPSEDSDVDSHQCADCGTIGNHHCEGWPC